MDRKKTTEILTSNIKTCAFEAGFDLVGIAPAIPAPNASAYEEWVKNGFEGEMAYMARNVEKRRHPGHVLSGAKSLVVVALNYKQPNGDSPGNDPLRGEVAQYARGLDYHDLMSEKLRAVLQYIEQTVDEPVNGKVYVDTGPVLERDFAVLAGIGWYGKHSNLINKNIGSWFLIGEILIDMELAYDAPVSDHCGTCTRCIDVCPTQAITEPYQVDSRRCISYLTIEQKGTIADELRPLIGNHIFGCDDCQNVCPWNRKAPDTREPAFASRPVTRSPRLVDLLAMSAEDFRGDFKGSPVKRSKRRGFLRNVSVALGNTRSPQAYSALASALSDEEPLIRQHAAWAVGQLGEKQAVRLLKDALFGEKDDDVRAELETSIGRLYADQA